ncbi:hypothetical protein X768_31935 [Mesorhizobium sp. LSJC265A00]|uniref:toll/interleukin-1 receptor domain-containing protein n=1 Tax=Mesorhizobium sp. LSJC265A00 TaxID=1287322 RepID=UPI0003CEFC0E|nr:toll/interleukin-1 receptor domain-containing protein [Mesorhizobium sp. LSJC265A00]ESW98089.1 hypothetical protein X768_31935 [Mesorhizobium sp. LSJC265A00]
MNYDFSSLSPTDFERLASDLVGREIGLRLETFPAGPDDAMDGRHVSADGTVVLQAKHYARSGFSKLKSKMSAERASIELLDPKRYILVTSVALTPGNKSALALAIGPALKTPGDILGADDLNALLRKYQDIEVAHQGLWAHSTGVLESVITGAVAKAITQVGSVPPALARLLPPAASVGEETQPASPKAERDVIFLIKSSPVDDEFTLWLAPKLEAEGYRVFADILTLQPGDRWRREINLALQYRAAKVLLISREITLADPHVQEDIDIALEMARELKDGRFIIPLRLGPARKVKGIGDAVAVDFVRGWGDGLTSLLAALQRQKVPRKLDDAIIDPNWETFRRRGAVPLVREPERLRSNWLRIVEAPDVIRFFESSGATDQRFLEKAIAGFAYPSAPLGSGILSFADQAEIDAAFQSVGRFRLKHEIPLLEFIEKGSSKLEVERQVASNLIVTMFKRAWYSFCRARGLVEYEYSNGTGFHASAALAATGQRIPWGRQGERRSSALRNSAKKHIWEYGVTALPSFWPFWHFKLKSRVLFSVDNGTPAGVAIDDKKKLHRLRRSICSGWRNKQWYGRMLAFLELLSPDSAYIRLELSAAQSILLEASPILFSSPVSTALPDVLDPDDEETDLSTLGRPERSEEELEG